MSIERPRQVTLDRILLSPLILFLSVDLSSLSNMEYKFLPTNKDSKAYSPIGVQKLFKRAVEDESGDIQAIFDKGNKYKTLLELWYASPLAVCIYKRLGFKFFMYPSDSPDIHFLKDVNQKSQEGFTVEIMTLFDKSKTTFDGDYTNLVATVWKSKGLKNYDRTALLLVSRLVGEINIYALAREMSKFKWNFLRIWFSAFNQINKSWTIFYIYPYPNKDKIGKFTVGLSELPY